MSLKTVYQLWRCSQLADESNDESGAEDNEVEGDPFMQSYAHILNDELKGTSLSKSFARADEQPLKKDEVSLD